MTKLHPQRLKRLNSHTAPGLKIKLGTSRLRTEYVRELLLLYAVMKSTSSVVHGDEINQ